MRTQTCSIAIKGLQLVLAVVVAGLSSGVAVSGAGDPLDVKRVTLNLRDADLAEITRALSEQLRASVCVEYGRSGLDNSNPPRFTLNINDVSARQALDTISRIMGSHLWRHTEAPLTINLTPRHLVDDPNWMPNRKCPGFKLENAPIWDIVDKTLNPLLGLEGEDKLILSMPSAYSLMGRPGEKWEDHPVVKFYRRRITATIKPGGLRDVLNQIVLAMGDARWSYEEMRRGELKMNVLSICPIEANLTPQPDASVPPAE